jgi:hypothetical protein
VIGSFEKDPIDLDMFKFDNVTTYTCLQALVYVPKSIQRAIVVGGVIVTLVDLVVDGDVGMIDNNVDS